MLPLFRRRVDMIVVFMLISLALPFVLSLVCWMFSLLMLLLFGVSMALLLELLLLLLTLLMMAILVLTLAGMLRCL